MSESKFDRTRGAQPIRMTRAQKKEGQGGRRRTARENRHVELPLAVKVDEHRVRGRKLKVLQREIIGQALQRCATERDDRRGAVPQCGPGSPAAEPEAGKEPQADQLL